MSQFQQSTETATATTTNNRAAQQREQVAAAAHNRMPPSSTTLGRKPSELLLLLALSSFAPLAPCLKVTVSIPELVKLNDAFWLNCSHSSPHRPMLLSPSAVAIGNNNNIDPTRASSSNNYQDIYSIKWYKDEEEFYRYLPNAEPKVSFYETKGVQPDKAKTFEGNVFLTKADVNTEGHYKCEILSEAPVFETVRKSKHLKVFALPVRGPRIEILDSNGKTKNPKAQEISYEVGDKIELRCNSAPSKPAARLRWYLNEREVPLPNSSFTASTDRQGRAGVYTVQSMTTATSIKQQPLGYNVQVTPIEYRVHYKGIYSSHSSLSLILERDHLANSRISFKCLASMRQEVPVASKQLVLLTPQSSPMTINRVRARRTLSELISASESEAHVPQHRHRAQYNRRGSGAPTVQPFSQAAASNRRLTTLVDDKLISSLSEDSKNQMMYIYEDSDSTLGPSVIDDPETLERYLSSIANDSLSLYGRSGANGDHALEFNRADNLEYIQFIRDKLSRQRSFPSIHPDSASSSPASHRRLYGPNSMVKSPMYLDEHDPLRPVINWPPLYSGKLMLLPPSQSIVAIPTQFWDANGQTGHELKFVMPPMIETTYEAGSHIGSNFEETTQMSRMILDRLMDNLNCTCTEGSIDLKLNWIVNEQLLNGRDVRLYPTRVSPDHRQTWATIGVQSNANQHVPGSLSSILSTYYRSIEAQARIMHSQTAALRSRPTIPSGQQVPVGYEQLKFMCQAIHSMLLYSSSEIITFDFNPPPVNEIDGDSINKFSSLPSNVIQAATTYPTKIKSSASWRSSSISTGSQKTIAALLMLLSSMYITLSVQTVSFQ